MHLGILEPIAKPLGIAFAFAESVIGTALITGIWRKVIGIAALAFQGFFTLLTLALVIFKPEMDCGCFGEAVHLTHMQTFLKNIILCILLTLYFFPTKHLGSPKKKKYVTFSMVTTSVVAFAVYSLLYIPLVDFTDYKPAAGLKAGNAFITSSEDLYQAVFIYEKDGEQATFSLENLPDSTWTFVRTETVEVSSTKNQGLIDLSFYDTNGEYMDELATTGKVMIVSVYNPSIGKKQWDNIAKFVSNAEKAGFKTFILSTDMPENEINATVYLSDYKTLITMNRSNAGVTYFNDGYLIRKWSAYARPDLEELRDTANEEATETIIYHNTKGSLAFQGFLLYVFAIMLLL